MDAEVVLGIEKANINYAQGCIDDDIKYNSRIAAALRQHYEDALRKPLQVLRIFL